MANGPAFSGIDYHQYASWPATNLGGFVYYQVPGQPGVYYDPRRNVYISANKINQEIQEQKLSQQKQDLAAQQLNQQLNPPGFLEQAVPVLGMAVGQGAAKPIGEGLAKGELPFGIGGGTPTTGTPAPSSGGGLFGGLFGTGAEASPMGAGAGAGDAGSVLGAGGMGSTAGAPATILGSETLATALPIAGAALGGYQAYQGFNEGDPVRGGLGGAGAGASVGFMVGGPVGAGIGAGIGGLLGVAGGLFGDDEPKNREGDRIEKLIEKGITPVLPDDGIGTHGSMDRNLALLEGSGMPEEVAENFVGYTPNGVWVNNRWYKSKGKETTLYTQDTTGYSLWNEELGNPYTQTGPEQRSKINAWALEHGLVNEHHGTMDLDGDEDMIEQWRNYSMSVLNGKDDPNQDFRHLWDFDYLQQPAAVQSAQQLTPRPDIAAVVRPIVQATPTPTPIYRPVGQAGTNQQILNVPGRR